MNIIRPSNAYCPGQFLHRVIPKAVVYGLTGRKLPLQGGGRAEKSYIHGRDLARAIHMVAEKAPLGTVYNAGPPKPMSIRALVETVAKTMGFRSNSCARSLKTDWARIRVTGSISAITRDLGWEPTISLEEGINEMVEWGKRYLDQLRDWPMDYTLRA